MLRAFFPLAMDTSPNSGPDMRAKAEQNMAALENWMAPLFAKTPHLPENARQSIAQVAPWIALIVGILGIAAILSAGGFASMFAFAYVFSGVSYFALYAALIVGLIAAILDLLAFKPLQARQKKGWNFIFYGTVLSAVSAILNLLFGYASLGTIIGPLVGFWLLFEIRGLYR